MTIQCFENHFVLIANTMRNLVPLCEPSTRWPIQLSLESKLATCDCCRFKQAPSTLSPCQCCLALETHAQLHLRSLQESAKFIGFCVLMGSLIWRMACYIPVSVSLLNSLDSQC